MNSAADSTSVRPSLGRDILAYLRHQLRGRRGVVLGLLALAAPGLWIGWPWLVAAGAAPLLISFAPCAIMCGLGLCAMKSCSKADAGTGAGAAALQRATATAASEPSTSSAASCSDCDSPAGAGAPLRRLSSTHYDQERTHA